MSNKNKINWRNILAILVVISCTTSYSNAYEDKFNMKDSVKITKDEAISVAKKYLIQKGWDKEYRLERAKRVTAETWYRHDNGNLTWSIADDSSVNRETRIWKVIFFPKVNFLKGGFQLFVIVNAETGEVEEAGNYKR